MFRRKNSKNQEARLDGLTWTKEESHLSTNSGKLKQTYDVKWASTFAREKAAYQ